MSRQIKTMEQMRDSRLLYEKKLPAFGYMILLIITALLIVVLVWSIYTPKTDVIKSVGIVESENKNYVMSQYNGELISAEVEEGSIVEEGDVLFQIKSTDLNLQVIQLEEQRDVYEGKRDQYEKLVQSIQDDTNYFDMTNPEDNLYYSQFEAYKSQIEQNQIDVGTFQMYGYSEEQIENELIKNQSKITEIYYSAIQAAESAMEEAQMQLESIDAQLQALKNGQGEYTLTANTSGVIHMLSDYKEGMVVQAAVPIASISSRQDEYSILSYVSPSDVAKIQVGDSVDIAVSGLTQSVYGTIEGVVDAIDTDITMSQSSQENENASYFKVYIRPKTDYLISRSGNKVNLSSGMTVETRIKYDEVSYFYYMLESLGVRTR